MNLPPFLGRPGQSIPLRNPSYKSVCAGDGHTEAMQVDFDPSQIEYKDLLKKFWSEPARVPITWEFVFLTCNTSTFAYVESETLRG